MIGCLVRPHFLAHRDSQESSPTPQLKSINCDFMGGVKWNISCHQKTKMPHLPTMPTSQNVNISPTSKQQTREVLAICHTKNLRQHNNLRMPQSFKGGQSQLISLRQTTVYVYNNKISNIRVKVTEQIHCEFQINPSGYIRTLITSWDAPS